MPREIYTPAEIRAKLRKADALFAEGKPLPEILKLLGATETAYRRWCVDYGRAGAGAARAPARPAAAATSGTRVTRAKLAAPAGGSDTWQNRGSARTLVGRLYPLSIFVSTSNSPWQHDEKVRILTAQQEAEDWLCKEARRYGVSLEFMKGKHYGLESDVMVDSIPHNLRSDDGSSGEKRTDWIAVIGKARSWRSALDEYHRLADDTNCDGVHAIVYANTSGTSYAMPYLVGNSPESRFLETCLVYRSTASDVVDKWMANTIAHEVLHLYGAWDMYAAPWIDAELQAVGARLYPHDVMIKNGRLSECTIGALTAWRVGWAPAEDWFSTLRPHD